MRAGGLPGPDHCPRLVGDFHPRRTRNPVAGAGHHIVAHPDRVSPTYLPFTPILACIDRASHLSHTVTSRFHRSVIVCSDGGLFYRASSGGGLVSGITFSFHGGEACPSRIRYRLSQLVVDAVPSWLKRSSPCTCSAGHERVADFADVQLLPKAS